MTSILFVVVLAVALGFVLRWAFHTLPKEPWQVIASVPLVKDPETGAWTGRNLTYYGLFIACSAVFSVALIFVLMGSVGISPMHMLGVTALLMIVCVPASRVIARIVEKKQHTFTVAGASFLGMFLAPVVIWLTNAIFAGLMGGTIPIVIALAAFAAAYSYGEALGRLGCISFGCCYGKRLSDCGPYLQRLFKDYAFVFTGKTKKISYADGFDETEVVPIQAVTAVVYVSVGLIATILFLWEFFAGALVLSVTVTQAWRVFSETLRADYRGAHSFSAYQIMSLALIPYVIVLVRFLPPAPETAVSVSAGLLSLWDPLVILFLQAMGIAIFLYLGQSTVTGSSMSFHVMKDRI